MVIVGRTRKERKALKYGETFLKLLGLTLENAIEFREILIENQNLVAANSRLLKENKELKGERNPETPVEGAESVDDYLNKKEEIK